MTRPSVRSTRVAPRVCRALFHCLLLTLLFAVPEAGAQGTSVSGADEALILPPSGAVITEYENFGYRLRFRDGGVEVRSVATPFRSTTPFRRSAGLVKDEMSDLAFRLTAGARSRQEAVSRVLVWMSANVRYERDRSESQEAAAVLRRRSGYCTGVARLTVALLGTLDIPAREVPGYVVAEATEGKAATPGYHRWVEVHYDDLGWIFSDPLATHHWVPATYVRLEREELIGDEVRQDGELISRRNGIRAEAAVWGVPDGILLRGQSVSESPAGSGNRSRDQAARSAGEPQDGIGRGVLN